MDIREHPTERPLSSRGRLRMQCLGELPIDAVLAKLVMRLRVQNTIRDPINRPVMDKSPDGWKR
jgi:hypothetical protein